MFLKKFFSGYKHGLSMSEILISLAIIGVLAAITMPVLRKAMPDKEENMHVKMNYIIEQVVGQLYDDDVMYAKKGDLLQHGFQNIDKVTINGVDYEGDTKFCGLFASKFNKMSPDVVCEPEAMSGPRKPSFTSTDGVVWYLPVTDFKTGSAEITIDLNGEDSGPNCSKEDTGCEKPDKFVYHVKTNGTVTFEEPGAVVNDKFEIILSPITNPEGGEYKIAKLVDGAPPPSESDYKSGAEHYKNLDRNTRYIIKAEPKEGYYTNWTMNKKRVTIQNSNVTVPLTFYKRSTHCVIVKLANCTEDDITKCATFKLNSNCGMRAATNGEYDWNTTDEYWEYVGSGGDHSYQCTGSTDMTIGKPKMKDDGTYDCADPAPYSGAHVCNLLSGDYQVEVTPNNGHKYVLSTDGTVDTGTLRPDGKVRYTYTYTGEAYKQEVRLGTSDFECNVSLKQKRDPNPIELPVDTPPPAP